MCEQRRRPLYFSHFATRTVYNTVHLYAMYAAIFVQNRVFCLPHLHSTPPLRGWVPSEYSHSVWDGKTGTAWLPDSEKNSKISLFVLTQVTNVTDGQTDGLTDAACRHIKGVASMRQDEANASSCFRGRRIMRQQEAFLDRQNAPKSLAAGASPQTPLG